MPTSFQESLETWTCSLLHEYVGQLEQTPVPEAAKEFNDPVWGTIEVIGRPLTDRDGDYARGRPTRSAQ